MRHYLTLAVLTSLILMAGTALTASASKALQGGQGEAQEQEKSVRMKDLPLAVQKTVREQSKGAVIRGLSQEIENGLTNYEVELKVKGHNKDVLIDPNGVVVEIEEQVTLNSLPSAARTTIIQSAGTGKIGMIESITKGNAVVAYEAHIRKGSKTQEIKVGPDGKLLPQGQD